MKIKVSKTAVSQKVIYKQQHRMLSSILQIILHSEVCERTGQMRKR